MSTLSDFDQLQYDWLKKEIEAEVAETRTLERNALLGSGAAWLWLLAPHKQLLSIEYTKFVWWTPVVFILLSAMRCGALYARFNTKRGYILVLEEKAEQTSKLKGWDTYLREQVAASFLAKLHLRLTGIVSIFFWIALLTTAIVAALTLQLSAPPPAPAPPADSGKTTGVP